LPAQPDEAPPEALAPEQRVVAIAAPKSAVAQGGFVTDEEVRAMWAKDIV